MSASLLMGFPAHLLQHVSLCSDRHGSPLCIDLLSALLSLQILPYRPLHPFFFCPSTIFVGLDICPIDTDILHVRILTENF